MKIASLSPVGIDLLVKKRSALWNIVVLKSQVLDLTEELNQNWIEIDSNETFLSQWGFFSVKKRLVKLVLSIDFNTLLPNLNLALVISFDVITEGSIELLDILELFTVLD